MNFNANSGTRHPQGATRKVKRVSDTNALGNAPIPTNQFMNMNPTSSPFNSTGTAGLQQQQQQQPFGQPNQPSLIMGMTQQTNNMGMPFQNTNIGEQINFDMKYDGGEQMNFGYPQSGISPQVQNQSQPQTQQIQMPQFQVYPGLPQMPQNQHLQQQQQPGMPNNIYGQPQQSIPPQFAMFQQPIVQDMAMQYGQKLADQGKQIMENQFEKWIPVTRLKYYFAVDNKYVINKIRLLFFPFTHKDWSLKYDEENPVQPRFDVNAPDLYIPTMAYISYVVLAGLLLGMQNRFTPEQLGIQASSALAYTIFELIIYLITLYVANISTNLKTLDLLAFSGYKFVIIVACISVSLLFYSSGYYIALIYCSLSLGFFLLRTLRTKVLNDANAQTAPAGGINYDPYGAPIPPTQFDYSVGRKRKLYFLFLVVGIQAFLSFWLSKHLILHGPIITTNVQVTP